MLKLFISLLIAGQVSTAMAKDELSNLNSNRKQIDKMRSKMRKEMELKRQEIQKRISSECHQKNLTDNSGNNIHICQSSKGNVVSVTQSNGNSNISIKSDNNKNITKDESCVESKDGDTLHISCKGKAGTVNIEQKGAGNIKIIQNDKIIINNIEK